MHLDEMKLKWAEYDRKLDESIRLNRQVLGAVRLSEARSELQRMVFFLGVEALLWLGFALGLGSFVYENAGMPRFAMLGAVVDLFAIGMLIATIREIVAARQMDYSQPVTAIQKELEKLRLLRIRVFQGAFLVGTLFWAPFTVVAAKAVFGLDVYSATWMWTNLAFGLAFYTITVWVSKRFSDRMERSPIVRRIMKDIAGDNLDAAEAFLRTLSEFEEESPV